MSAGMIVWAVILGLIPGGIAYTKGRPFLLWWLFGAALFIVALPAALLVKPIPGVDEKVCGACGMVVPAELTSCRRCHRPLPPVPGLFDR